jgi:hypothetical protein
MISLPLFASLFLASIGYLFWLLTESDRLAAQQLRHDPQNTDVTSPHARNRDMSQQQDYKSMIERAFEITDSDGASSLGSPGCILSQEGYSPSMITGPFLHRQLRERIAAHRRAT